jgi:hypothetical protein
LSRTRKLNADQPQLLFQRAGHPHQEIARDWIVNGDPIDPPARARCSLGKPIADRLQYLFDAEMASREWLELSRSGDRLSLAVRGGPHRHRLLGHIIRQISPSADEFVQLLVYGAKVGSLDVPVGVLADQRQIEKIDEHPL